MRIRLLLIIVGAVLLGVVVVPYTREFFAVDACLDGGGSFDYYVGACDPNDNHVYVPFSTRHAAAVPAIVAGGALMLIGLFAGKDHR